MLCKFKIFFTQNTHLELVIYYKKTNENFTQKPSYPII